jgi:DeoD family purine-nucleoside phosphorylase
MSTPIHLHPTAPLADRVLLPGDPGRALLLAQGLLEEPKMFNHNRGLWGYTGAASDGEPLTIQSTGMGGPSAAIVISELVDLGARRLIRVGTCGALHPSLGLGDLLIAVEAISADGTSQALAAGSRLAATPALLAALQDGVEAAGAGSAHSGNVVSTDLFYDDREGLEDEWVAAGAWAVEMEAATLFALAARRGFEAAAVMLVSDVVRPERLRITLEELRRGEERLGEVAARALVVAR